MNEQHNVRVFLLLLVITGSFSYAYVAANAQFQQEPGYTLQALVKPESMMAQVAGVTLSDKVVITMAEDGVTHTFLKSRAVDKGNFTSPAGFTQKNLCATTSTMPHMTVCFRPDADGRRDEVVFEYGTFMQPPQNTEPYVATFYVGDTTKLGEKPVYDHYFYQRWRWIPQGYRPRYRTLASLEAAKLLPPYRKGVDPDEKNDTIGSANSECVYDSVFDSSCITLGMGQTGERDDLGQVTGWQGQYLLTQSDAWWNVVLSQAEAGMGVPWNIRDEGGTPINFFRSGPGIIDRTALTWHSNHWGQSYSLDNHTNNNTGWNIDSSHQPALNYLPWLLTGDPYYLEGLQFQSSSNVMYTNWARGPANLHAVMEDQLRGDAWNLRTLLGLAISTPDSVPGWLNPRSYYQQASKENAAESVRDYVNNTSDPLIKVLHTESHSFWQQDFFAAMTGWALWSGLTEWKPVYDFAIQNPIARVNGSSGWERRCPTVYNWGTPDFRSFVPPDPTSWGQAWSIELANNHRVVPSDTSLLCGVDAYTSYLLGTLAMATHLGTPNAESYYRWLSDAMKATLKSSVGGYTEGPKWAVAPASKLATLPQPAAITDAGPILKQPIAEMVLPTVSITNPANGATVSGTWFIAYANATDNVAMRDVQFKLDGKRLGLATTAVPYRVIFDTTKYTNGTHSLTATAHDWAGNAKLSSAVSITINNASSSPLPTITLSANPETVTSGQSSTLTWSGTNATACSGTATNGGTQTSGTKSVTPTITTTYSISCTGAGGSSSGSVTVSVPVVAPPVTRDLTPPTVSITAPANSVTVSGTNVAVSADATDNGVMRGVQFLLDGNKLGAEDTTSPYSVTWNTTGAPNGTHQLFAVARDSGGASGVLIGNQATSSARSLTVNNQTTPAPVTPTATLGANPTSITTGESSILTWSGTDAVSCTGTGTNGGTQTSGTKSVTPTVTTTYSVTCTSATGGTATANASITVTPVTPPPPTTGFSIGSVSTTPGDFTQTNNCGPLALGASCTVSVIFTPTQAGTRTSTLSIADSTGKTYTVALSGTGASVEATPAEIPADTSTSPIGPTTSGNTLIGTSGNDTLDVVDGIHIVDGLDGYDTANVLVVPDSSMDWWKMTKNSDGSWSIVDIHATGYEITLKNIEALKLQGGTSKVLAQGDRIPNRAQVASPESRSFLSWFVSKIIVFFGGGNQNIAAPILALSPTSLTFDTTIVGQTSTKTITLTYKEDGTVSTGDTRAPKISSIRLRNLSETSATVTFRTDESALGQVKHGTDGTLSQISAQTVLGGSHSITLTGLSANTRYYYRITVVDAAGNVRTSSQYSFRTRGGSWWR